MLQRFAYQILISLYFCTSKILYQSQAVVVHIINPSTLKAEAERSLEFEASQVYRASSRTGSKEKQKNPVSKYKQNITSVKCRFTILIYIYDYINLFVILPFQSIPARLVLSFPQTETALILYTTYHLCV